MHCYIGDPPGNGHVEIGVHEFVGAGDRRRWGRLRVPSSMVDEMFALGLVAGKGQRVRITLEVE